MSRPVSENDRAYPTLNSVLEGVDLLAKKASLKKVADLVVANDLPPVDVKFTGSIDLADNQAIVLSRPHHPLTDRSLFYFPHQWFLKQPELKSGSFGNFEQLVIRLLGSGNRRELAITQRRLLIQNDSKKEKEAVVLAELQKHVKSDMLNKGMLVVGIAAVVTIATLVFLNYYGSE